ncbi:MAG TPA: hypothetical protein VGN11_10560, partial [Candidatus Baltobacteraceae bacterium]|nr:hypothetical protein [Candidatus Baltobacteraceae bacterium]
DCGTPAFLVDNPGDIDPLWFSGVETLGVSAGASSPESLVQAAIERIRCLEPQFERIEEVGKAEPVMIFRAPLELTARQ